MSSTSLFKHYSKSARYFIITITTVLCILLNYIVNHLVNDVFHLPLFLDTIGTVTVTFIFGIIPGLICSFITTVIDSFIGEYFLHLPMLYVICAFAAVFLTAFFKKFIFNASSKMIKFCYLFILAIVMCIVISVLGGIIDTISVQYSSYQSNVPVASDFFKPSFVKIGLSTLATNIAARFPVNIIDRLITAYGSYGLVALYRYLHKKLDEKITIKKTTPPPSESVNTSSVKTENVNYY